MGVNPARFGERATRSGRDWSSVGTALKAVLTEASQVSRRDVRKKNKATAPGKGDTPRSILMLQVENRENFENIMQPTGKVQEEKRERDARRLAARSAGSASDHPPRTL